jgi:hypothetical protein
MYHTLQHLKTVPLSKQSLCMFNTIRTANRDCVYVYIVTYIFVEVLELRLHRNKKQWLHKIAENNGCAMNVSDLTF